MNGGVYLFGITGTKGNGVGSLQVLASPTCASHCNQCCQRARLDEFSSFAFPGVGSFGNRGIGGGLTQIMWP